MKKRVPNQHHLTLYTQASYKRLPLVNCQGGFVGEYLERLYCVLSNSVQKYSRVFAVRVDLRFPQYYFPFEQESLSNNYLDLFIKDLRRRLQQYKNEKQRAGARVHGVTFEYVWARQYGQSSNKPHFHLLLLF